MFEIDPQTKVEMLKKHKMKQMLRKVKRDKILQGIKGGGLKDTDQKQQKVDDTVKILEVLGQVNTASKRHPPHIKLVAPQAREEGAEENIAFPLAGYLKNKKIKDVTSSPAGHGIP